MFNLKKEEIFLAASGLLTLTVVAYVDAFIKHDGNVERLLGYAAFAVVFTILEMGNTRAGSLAHRLGVLGEALIGLVMYAGGTSAVMPILFVIWAAQLPKAFPNQHWWVFLAAVNVIMISYQLYLGSTAGLVTALVFLGFQGFAASSSAVRMSAKRAKEELEETYVKLKSTQTLLAQRGKAQERVRIARDLHDGIGHKLIALSLKLEHAKHTLAVPAAPLLAELKDEVTEILQDLRHTVQHMRSVQHLSLADVVQEIQNNLPHSVEVSCDPNIGVADIALGEQLAYCIQEAVSNALRHGLATRIDIQQEQPSPLIITVTDNGKGTSSWEANGGLKGIQERLAPYGGEVELTPNPKPNGTGMQLRLTLAKTAAHD